MNTPDQKNDIVLIIWHDGRFIKPIREQLTLLSPSFSRMLEDVLARWRRGSRGPLPQLTGLQVLTALIIIQQEGPVGRRALSQGLRINDGVARGLLERLAEKGVVEIAEKGALLSQAGELRLKRELGSIGVKGIHEVSGTELVPGRKAIGILLEAKYKEGMTGVRERDAAVRAGADGMITLAVRNGRLVIPPDDREISAEDRSVFEDQFRLSEKDLLIIGFANDSSLALTGALSAAILISS